MTKKHEKIDINVSTVLEALVKLKDSQLEQDPSKKEALYLLIQFNNHVLNLLDLLKRDKIGCDLLHELEESLQADANAVDYVECLYSVLIANQDKLAAAIKKERALSDARYELRRSIDRAIFIALLTGISVYIILVLCSVLIPTPAHLILLGFAMVLAPTFNILFGLILERQAVVFGNRAYELENTLVELRLIGAKESSSQTDDRAIEAPSKTGKLMFFYQENKQQIQGIIDSMAPNCVMV